MSSTASDAFLNGEDIRVDPRAIESELIRLWGPAAERAGGPTPDHPNVTRIVLANLILVGDVDGPSGLGQTLDTVSERYPSRAIVVRRTREPGRAISAEVSALCHLPAPGLPQVCSERIILNAGPDASDLIPGAVRPLLETDLPVVLWWTDDPRDDPALFRALAGESSRLILDLPDPDADVAALREGLDPGLHPFARDAAWFGITPWRELVAKFFDPPCNEGALRRIEAVSITVAARDAGRTSRRAAWLVAWLAGQLGWTPAGQPAHAPGTLSGAFKSQEGDVAFEIRTEVRAGLATPTLTGISLTIGHDEGNETFSLTRKQPDSADVYVNILSSRTCALPRAVDSPILGPARCVAAGLESARKDIPFQRALPHLLWLLEAGTPEQVPLRPGDPPAT